MSKLIALADASHLSHRVLPTAPDGRYDGQVQPATEPTSPANTDSAIHKLATAADNIVKQAPSITDITDDITLLIKTISSRPINDRDGLFPKLFSILSRLPADSAPSKKLNDLIIETLYNSIPHPPATFIGSDFPGCSISSVGGDIMTPTENTASTETSTTYEVPPPRMPFSVRSADGKRNNALFPNLGAAGMPYARTAQNRYPLARNALPDTGLVFDTLLKARDWKPHPGGNSALTFSFALLVTHQLFRTDPRDMTRNNTSSYLDLSILYGNSQDAQNMVRDRDSGCGLLWPDAYSEDRLNFVPPAASALLVILSRNHNYVADMLLKINERGRWTDPPPADEKKRAMQDEEIFQVARLVNCGHFMAMIFGDYVAGFLGLGRDGSSWSMNPFDPIEDIRGNSVTRGLGNHCSVEFNLLYRWHPTTAQVDIQSTEKIFKEAFGDKPFDQISMEDFIPGVVNVWQSVDSNPRTRTFGNLKRGPDGKFNDDDLARILQDSTESPAGAYRAQGTPAVLRIVEIMGMEQGREWGVCTMNEFRDFLGLKRFATFEEWNSDQKIADIARRLYGHIDNLELYAGLQAEEIMPLGPGSGICCGYTMTRAILSDAIALVRGDRFYTTDYTPGNLTTWGIQDCARDPDNGAFGAALPKLLLRHLPRHYPANSVYALFPFFTPATTKQNLTKLGIVDGYALERPKVQGIPKVVDTLTGIRYVFDDYTKFKTTYGPDMRLMTNNYGFFLVFDELEPHTVDKAMLFHALLPDKATMQNYTAWYKKKTEELLKENSYQLSGTSGMCVDIVRNVINLVSVHWVSEYLFNIPLKTRTNPKGMFTEQEVYDMLALLFSCVFINVLPEHGWSLTHNASRVAAVVNNLIEQSVKEAAQPALGITSVLLANKTYLPFLRKLVETGRPMKEIVANVLGLATGSSVNFAQSVAQVVDFYLDDKYAKERAEIIDLVQRDDADSMDLIIGYVKEAQRLNPQFAGLLRVSVTSDNIPMGGGRPPVQVQPGDILFSSYRNAHLNPADFPNPETVDPRRPRESYEIQGAGFHGCPGVSYTEQTVPEMIKVIFNLKNLRRAPGNAGNMSSFMLNRFGTDNKMYITNTGNVSTWPSSLNVLYDQ